MLAMVNPIWKERKRTMTNKKRNLLTDFSFMIQFLELRVLMVTKMVPNPQL